MSWRYFEEKLHICAIFKELRNRRSYRVSSAYQEYDIRKRESTNTVLASSLSGKHTLFNLLEFDWAGGFSQSNNLTPLKDRFQFRELGAFNVNDESDYSNR